MLLLAEFGSVSAVLGARRSRLAACLPSHPAIVALLVSAATAMRHGLAEQILVGPLLPDLRTVVDYLRIDLEHLPFERVRVLYLSARHHLISDEIVCDGGLGSADIAPRQVVGRALELAAAGVVLAHNHPSGDPTPSQADIELTRHVAAAGQPLGVSVLEHIVIGFGEHRSFRALGFL
ncbi:JAB domain-containing protein [Sphingomonas immobilis]|uniref:JAB domain-containing protein n=1 Tax=Sphingomonas immobilis TaxID=3063997 RepID=A0ABT9A195_9SPHN|nr:JAB domain-containing protein [Sphingomonas sp. CA1-15]MDO7843598.1 JAB domain-containing protein [Sphingomonas sp. CA1-15]